MRFLFGAVLFWTVIPVFSMEYRITATDDPLLNGKVLSETLSKMKSADSLLLTAGTFQGNFALRDQIAVYGGFSDSAFDWKNRDFKTTVLDGNQSGSVVRNESDKSYHFYSESSALSEFKRIKTAPGSVLPFPLLEGVVITNGNGQVSSGRENGKRIGGGALGPLWLRHCSVLNNKAEVGGGCYGVIAESSLIGNNTARDDGGTANSVLFFSAVVNNSANNKPAGSSDCFVCVIANNAQIRKENEYGSYSHGREWTGCVIWGNEPSQCERGSITFSAVMGSEENSSGFYNYNDDRNEGCWKISGANGDLNGPQFLMPSTFRGALSDRMEEILHSDWRVFPKSLCVGRGSSGSVIPKGWKPYLQLRERAVKLPGALFPKMSAGIGIYDDGSGIPYQDSAYVLPPVIYVATYGNGSGLTPDSPMNADSVYDWMVLSSGQGGKTAFYLDAGVYENGIRMFPKVKVYGGFDFPAGVVKLGDKREPRRTILTLPYRMTEPYGGNTDAPVKGAGGFLDGVTITSPRGSAVRISGEGLVLSRSWVVNCQLPEEQYSSLLQGVTCYSCVIANNSGFQIYGNELEIYFNSLIVNNIWRVWGASAGQLEFSQTLPSNFVFWGNRMESGQPLLLSIPSWANSQMKQHCALEGGLGSDATVIPLSEENDSFSGGPGFVNPTSFRGADQARFHEILEADWHFSDSRFTDKGGQVSIPAGVSLLDLGGNERIFNKVIDIGPYESQTLP